MHHVAQRRLQSLDRGAQTDVGRTDAGVRRLSLTGLRIDSPSEPRRMPSELPHVALERLEVPPHEIDQFGSTPDFAVAGRLHLRLDLVASVRANSCTSAATRPTPVCTVATCVSTRLTCDSTLATASATAVTFDSNRPTTRPTWPTVLSTLPTCVADLCRPASRLADLDADLRAEADRGLDLADGARDLDHLLADGLDLVTDVADACRHLADVCADLRDLVSTSPTRVSTLPTCVDT